LKDNSK